MSFYIHPLRSDVLLETPTGAVCWWNRLHARMLSVQHEVRREDAAGRIEEAASGENATLD